MLVIDTSVAIKWAIPEQGSDEAVDLLSRSFIAPDLFQAEVANTLAKKVRGREISAAQALQAFRQISDQVTLVRAEAFGPAAFDLSLLLSHSVYDCYFFVAAEALGYPLVTADAVFTSKLRGTGYAALVYLLGEEIPDA